MVHQQQGATSSTLLLFGLVEPPIFRSFSTLSLKRILPYPHPKKTTHFDIDMAFFERTLLMCSTCIVFPKHIRTEPKAIILA